MSRSLPALLCAVALAWALPAHAGRGTPTVERARYLMGTLCVAQAEGRDTLRTAAALAAALDTIAALERSFSAWIPASELNRLNAAAARAPFACSPHLFAVIDSAFAAARASGGTADPTIEPLILAWDLRGKGRIPDLVQVAAARRKVGWEKVTLDRAARTVAFAEPGMGIDLGGIGKGYALDQAARELRRRGVRRALLNFGGEMRALSDRGPWTVDVADPADRLKPAVRLTLAEGAVSTSSQLERGFERNGARYGHVLDPRTGTPVLGAASVTVVAPHATRSDAFDTALLVMGRDEAERFAKAHPALGVLWLEPGGAVVRAWAWNLDDVAAAPGANVEWMNRPAR